MFRSDEEAAHHRADDLQRDLDASRTEVARLRRELANTKARLASVDGPGVVDLRSQIDRLTEQLASTKAQLAASQAELRRFRPLPPVPMPVRRRFANPTRSSSTPSAAPPIAIGVALLLVCFVFFVVLGAR